MIFVTVGNHYKGFDRLVKKMDEIAENTSEKVIIQIGQTYYKPKNAKFFDFTDYGTMQKLCKEARVVVSHAGVGSIITALEQQTPIIIVPRLKKYNEVIDDHQLDIAEALLDHQLVKTVYDLTQLEESLKSNFNMGDRASNKNKLSGSIKNYLIMIS
jgi:UDP-N-acetylglucosamine transferase subunit ALG13